MDDSRGEKPQHSLATSASSSPQSSAGLEIPATPEHGKYGDQLSSDQNDEIVPPESEYLSGFALWINMVSLMLSIFLIAMDMVGVSVLLR